MKKRIAIAFRVTIPDNADHYIKVKCTRRGKILPLVQRVETSSQNERGKISERRRLPSSSFFFF